MADFRFEDLEIWKDAIKISDILFDCADKAEDKKFLDLQSNSEPLE